MSPGIDETPQTHQARCVIWRDANSTVPAELSGALERRGVVAVECDNACWAMAELCRMHTEEPDTPVILLLLNPGSLEEVDRVLAVAQQYAPHATAWVYDSSKTPALRALTRLSERGVSGNRREEQGRGQAEPSAGLRLTEVPEQEEEAKPDNQAEDCQTGQDSPSILSRDELASLKHPDQVTDSEA